MEFIDNTGHVFSLPSYDNQPTGYEYEANKYIFWIDEEYNNRLSINNYYIKCIRAFVDLTNIEYNSFKIDITSSSNIFKLLPSTLVQNKLSNFNGITIDEFDFVDTLIYDSDDIENSTISLIENINDYNYIPVNYSTLKSLNESVTIYKFDTDTHEYIVTTEFNEIDNFYIRSIEPNVYCVIPFYVAANSAEEGTWTSNILIHVSVKAESQQIVKFEKELSNIVDTNKNFGLPMYIQALEDDVIVETLFKGTYPVNLQVSLDNESWSVWDNSKIINESEKLFFKCAEDAPISIDDAHYMYFDISGKFNVGGNIMSLIKDDFDVNYNFRPLDSQDTTKNAYAFYKLFSNNKNLISAADLVLPSLNTSNYCYYGMFTGCTNLSNPPLKIETNYLVPYSYVEMFSDCKSLVTTPYIHIHSFSFLIKGMINMFAKCNNLKSIYINLDEFENNYPGLEYHPMLFTDVIQWVNAYTITGGCLLYDINIFNLFLPYNHTIINVNTLDETNVMNSISNHTKYTILTSYSKEIDFNDWCSISVGGIFIDESEELIINGKNMGINLPKDIIKAIYQSNFFDSYIDESLYNEKIKEYLFNYMQIKGECGNFRSAINSLKWFGWGDKITISKLLRNDNKFINQFLIDNFDINNDIPKSARYFKNTPNISLVVKGYKNTGEFEDQDFTKDYFIGEGHPILKNLFDEVIEVQHDNITFYKSFFDYTFNELSLKLACLRYYYKKYFLPIHLKIHSASVNFKTYTNDIKYICTTHVNIDEDTYLIKDDNVYVEINYNEGDIVYFANAYKYVDENFNEFSHYKELGEKYENNIYIVDDTCLTIPIRFTTKHYNADGSYEYLEEGFYNTHIIVENADGNTCFESHFSFVQNKDGKICVNTSSTSKMLTMDIKYNNLVIYPKFLMTTEQYDLTQWIDVPLTIHVCCNDTWFKKTIHPSLANTFIEMGKIKYNYSNNFKQLASLTKSGTMEHGIVKFNSYINDPQFIIMDDINYMIDINDTSQFANIMKKYINEVNISSLHKYYNRVLIYNIFHEGELLKYSPSDDLYNLYSIFFEDNNGIITPKIKLNSGLIDYDMYLMHEEPKEGKDAYWYIVFISQDIMNLDDDYYNVYDNIINIPFTKTSGLTTITDKYTLRFYKASNKFLINRYDFESVNGVNHFTNDDIILARLPNDKLAFNYNMSSKWEVTPYSLGMGNTSTVYANNNICIVSISPNRFDYTKGVYNIKVNYCVDNFIEHSITKKCIFKVD